LYDNGKYIWEKRPLLFWRKTMKTGRIAVFLLAAFLASFSWPISAMAGEEDTISQGVYAESVSLGGMT